MINRAVNKELEEEYKTDTLCKVYSCLGEGIYGHMYVKWLETRLVEAREKDKTNEHTSDENLTEREGM